MTTIFCPTCSGVQTMTAGSGPVHVRWCECQPFKDAEDLTPRQAVAEIMRLRALVREAYDEGGDASTARGYLLPEDWDASNAKKALGP